MLFAYNGDTLLYCASLLRPLLIDVNDNLLALELLEPTLVD